MKLHVEYGSRLLEPIRGTAEIRKMVGHHHEFFDGSGYPNALSGQQIPLGARIIAIADAYDTITSERTYKKARTGDDGILELIRCSGAQFDPELIGLFTTRLRELPSSVITVAVPAEEPEVFK